MIAVIAYENVAAFGGEEALAAAVADFQQALADHAASVGIPAPVAHPIVEEIVRLHGGEFEVLPPPVTGEPEPTSLQSRAALRRWQREVGGITVDGLAVATDDRSKMMLMGARIAAVADENFSTQWKTPVGFITLDAPTIIALSNAVLAHVDACFAIEAGVLADITSGEITTPAEIDAAFT